MLHHGTKVDENVARRQRHYCSAWDILRECDKHHTNQVQWCYRILLSLHWFGFFVSRDCAGLCAILSVVAMMTRIPRAVITRGMQLINKVRLTLRRINTIQL